MYSQSFATHESATLVPLHFYGCCAHFAAFLFLIQEKCIEELIAGAAAATDMTDELKHLAPFAAADPASLDSATRMQVGCTLKL
jgi:hypothetical protein